MRGRAGVLGAELEEETAPRSSAGSSPLLRTQAPQALPLNLASLPAIPLQPWSAPLIPAAWGQPEEPWKPGFDTLDKPRCHLTSPLRSITC